MSIDRLIAKIKETANPTVLGLDPRLDYIPDSIKQAAYDAHSQTPAGAAAAILSFNQQLIDVTYDIIPAVKPQAAFYELFGWQGVRALAETIAYAKARGMYVIADSKRNDIGSTMQAYADAWLGEADIEGERHAAFDADALTVNAYLGSDTIEPLLEVCRAHDRAIFVLAKTSNPSSGELQDIDIGGRTVYQAIAAFCDQWGEQLPGAHGYHGVGAVVGATYPEQLAELRQQHPELFFLVPGYGAQGGDGASVAAAFDADGMGAIINASRSLICAWQQAPDTNLAKATRDAALRMREDIATA